ncbi:MAG: histidine triad nucleotide-binding protein [Christensenellales bacterium]
MNDCIFCKIGAGEIPSKKFYEDENMFVVADIDPKAEKLSYDPEKHYALLSEATGSDCELLGKCLKLSKSLRRSVLAAGIARYKSGRQRGSDRTPPHVHVLGGERLTDSFN